MSGFQKTLRKLAGMTQYENIILNKNGLEIILMKPNERFMIEMGRDIQNSIGLLSNLKVKENLDKFMSIIEKLLTETIRHPDDYGYKLIVPDNAEEIQDYQERFSSFNPKIDNEALLAQKLITPYEFDIDALGSGASKIVIFLLALRMMGILNPQTEAPPKEEEDKKKDPEEDQKNLEVIKEYNEIESFPLDNKNSKEVSNN
jgi:hypothetical protein